LAANLDRVCYLGLIVSQPHYIQISAFFTVEADFIDTSMKLPSGQSINSPVSAKKTPDGAFVSESKAAIPQNKTVNASSLNQLSSTWAKVKSSQPLSAEQVQRVINQDQTGNPTTKFADAQMQGKPPGTTPLLQKQMSDLVNQLNTNQTSTGQIKLFLTKLDTQQGLLSLLTQKSYPKGNSVLIQLDAKGTWQLQSNAQDFSLTKLSAQFSTTQASAPKLPLDIMVNVATHITQANHTAKATPSVSTLSIRNPINAVTSPPNINLPLPSTTLVTDKPINSETIKQAIQHSGQTLENKLQQQLSLGTQTQSPSKPSVNTGTTPDFSSRFKHVEQQMNQWVKQVSSELLKGKINPSMAIQTQPSQSKGSTDGLTNTPQALSNTDTKQINPLINDSKNWLMQNQKRLVGEFQQALIRNNSFIPNWANTGQFKSAAELNDFFSLLLSPKQNHSKEGANIWPNNLSAQSQINQTLSQLVALIPDSDKDTMQSQLLRQILNISQSLMKIQHDQIHNRLGQQNDLPQSIQMSLPYLHQNQIQWADFEYKQTEHKEKNKERTTGWHLILRFCQDTPESFAVESQLKQNALNVILWATETPHLKILNQHIPLLKQKMIAAGFDLDSIISKHGSPVKLQQPIQQSIVDVHT